MKRLISSTAILFLFTACKDRHYDLTHDPANKIFVEILRTKGIPVVYPANNRIECFRVATNIFDTEVRNLLDQYNFALFADREPSNTSLVALYGQMPGTKPEFVLTHE